MDVCGIVDDPKLGIVLAIFTDDARRRFRIGDFCRFNSYKTRWKFNFKLDTMLFMSVEYHLFSIS